MPFCVQRSFVAPFLPSNLSASSTGYDYAWLILLVRVYCKWDNQNEVITLLLYHRCYYNHHLYSYLCHQHCHQDHLQLGIKHNSTCKLLQRLTRVSFYRRSIVPSKSILVAIESCLSQEPVISPASLDLTGALTLQSAPHVYLVSLLEPCLLRWRVIFLAALDTSSDPAQYTQHSCLLDPPRTPIVRQERVAQALKFISSLWFKLSKSVHRPRDVPCTLIITSHVRPV